MRAGALTPRDADLGISVLVFLADLTVDFSAGD